MKPNRIFWLGLMGSAFALVLIMAPVVEGVVSGPGPFTLLSRQAFRLLCHQHPERSLHLFGVCLPVCVRCAGVYLGFFLGWLGWHFLPAARRDQAIGTRALILGLAPLGVDGAINALGLWVSPVPVRLLTGLLCGAVAARALWPALLEAFANPIIVRRDFISRPENPPVIWDPSSRRER